MDAAPCELTAHGLNHCVVWLVGSLRYLNTSATLTFSFDVFLDVLMALRPSMGWSALPGLVCCVSVLLDGVVNRAEGRCLFE